MWPKTDASQEEIQEVIRDMVEIVNDPSATEDERNMACSTMTEALIQQFPWEEMRWSASQLETMWRNLQERNIIRHTDERQPMYDSIPFLKWLGDSLDDVIVELVRRHGPSVLDWLQAVVDNAIANAKVKLDAEETT